MYAGDELYDDDATSGPLFAEPCDFPMEATYEDGHLVLDRCGLPAVQDDEDGCRCEEHLGATA